MVASSLLQTPVPAPTSTARELFDLNNETLSSIVRNLEAPAAVCLALSCKHMKTLVTSVCGREIGAIVPKYANSDEGTPVVLPHHSPSKEVRRILGHVDAAIHTCIDIGLGQVVAGQKQYSPEKITLLSQLNYRRRLQESHLLRGHDECRRSTSSVCAVCGLLDMMESSHHAGRLEMVKELHESGELIYTEEDIASLDSDAEDEEGDSDDSDAGESGNDADDDDNGGSEIDDGLNDPDFFSIHTESERSADEDDVAGDGANDEDGRINAEMSDVGSTTGWAKSAVAQIIADMAVQSPHGDADDDEDDAMDDGASENQATACSSGSQDDDEASDSDDEDADDNGNELSDDDGDSDPDSDDSDHESERDDRAPVQKLSNEILTSIICELDPPTAVCLGLSCKYFYRVVPDVCQTTFRKICPRFADECSGSPSLPPYYPTPEEILLQRYASTAIKLVDAVRDYDESRPKCLLSTDYIALMNRLSEDDFLLNPYNWNNYCSMYEGHMRDSPGAFNNCGVCTVMQLMQAFRALRNHGAGEGPSDYEFNYIENRAEIAWPEFR